MFEIAQRQIQQKKDLIKVADDIITAGWKKAAADRVSKVLTDRVMRDLRTRSRCKSGSWGICKLLAAEARFLLSAQDKYQDAIAALANRIQKSLRRPKLEQLIADRFAHHIPLPGNEQIEATARALQHYGIYLCVIDGIPLTRCRCFSDLCEHEVEEKVKEVITSGLDKLEDEYFPGDIGHSDR